MTWPQTRPRWALAPHPTPGRAGARPADRALGVDALLAAAFLVDLVTPFLIWKGVLPDAVRWGSHASLAAMMLLAVAHIMQQDRVPGVVLAIVILSAIGLAAGYLRGQGITATAWGWWVMFQFPVVGLYAYTRPGWPARWPETVRRALVIGLAAVVAVQVGQYLTGETPGDNLAGLFGRHGTANLMLYVALVVSVGLGLWLALANLWYRDVKYLFAVGIQMWMFLTNVLYPLPQDGTGLMRWLTWLNPMVPIIGAYRQIVIEGQLPPAMAIVSPLWVATALTVSGWAAYRALEGRFAERV